MVMSTAITPLILQILLGGMDIWKSERRSAFQKKHAEILERVRKAKDAHFPEFNGAILALAERDMEVFYMAYLQEQKAHNVEVASLLPAKFGGELLERVASSNPVAESPKKKRRGAMA